MPIVQWLLIVGTAASFVFCDVLSASWAKTENKWFLLPIFFIAPFGYFIFGLLNKVKSLPVSAGFVNMFIFIGTILVGIFLFDAQLETKQALGLMCAVVAIALLI